MTGSIWLEDLPEAILHEIAHFLEPWERAILAAALGTYAHQLQVLNTDTAAIALSSADLHTVLRNAPNLEQISLEFSCRPAIWDDRGAALMHTVSRLPALQSLRISTSNLSKPTQDDRRTGVELTALSSAQLTYLDLDIDTSSERTLSFGDLLALTDCTLSGCGKADVHVTASSFSPTPNLTALTFNSIGSFHLAPNCFTSLSFLTDLRLSGCGLLVVPPALAGVRGTLRRLDLSCNAGLGIEGIGYGVLLSLSALESISLIKEESHTYRGWDDLSLQYIHDFLTDWQALRPGVKLPTPHVFDDDFVALIALMRELR